MTEVVEKPVPEDSVVIRVIAEKVPGEVKWYNNKKRYGFIQREDIDQDVFVHRSGILKYKNTPCLWKGLKVEFSVVETSKGIKAESVTAPDGGEIVRRRVRKTYRNHENGADGDFRRPRRPPGRPPPQNGEVDRSYYDSIGVYNHPRGRPDENGGHEGEVVEGQRPVRLGRRRPRGGRGGIRPQGQNNLDSGDHYADGDAYQNGENGGLAPGPRMRTRRPRNRRGGSNLQDGDNLDQDMVENVGHNMVKPGPRGPPRRRGRGGGGYIRGRAHALPTSSGNAGDHPSAACVPPTGASE